MPADNLDKEERTEKATLNQRSALAPVIAKLTRRYLCPAVGTACSSPRLWTQGQRTFLLLNPCLEQRDAIQASKPTMVSKVNLNRAARMISQCHFHVSLDLVLH